MCPLREEDQLSNKSIRHIEWREAIPISVWHSELSEYGRCVLQYADIMCKGRRGGHCDEKPEESYSSCQNKLGMDPAGQENSE